MSLTTELYNTAIGLLSARWPDVYEGWREQQCRAVIWKALRGLDENAFAEAIRQVIEAGVDEWTPYEIARRVVAAARRIAPEQCTDPVTLFRLMLEEKARDYPPWDDRPVPVSAIPHPDPTKRAEGWKHVPRKENETNE